MLAYTYDAEGVFSGTNEAQIDPLESEMAGREIWLLPADSVWEAPPEHDPATQLARWNGTSWTVEEIPPEPEPEPMPEPEREVTTAEMAEAIRKGVNEV